MIQEKILVALYNKGYYDIIGYLIHDYAMINYLTIHTMIWQDSDMI